ncbi:hypothetical protein Hanom_Chr00s212737g01841071 [Helianthus anomalus]
MLLNKIRELIVITCCVYVCIYVYYIYVCEPRPANPTRDHARSRVNSELGQLGPKPILDPLGIYKPVTHTPS